MSASNPTKFEKKGMELYRNGKHIATRLPHSVQMMEGFEKFQMMAEKQLDSKKFCADNNLEWLGLSATKKDVRIVTEKDVVMPISHEEEVLAKADKATMEATVQAPSIVPEAKSDEVQELMAIVRGQAKQIEELMEMNADKMELAPPPVNQPKDGDSVARELARAEERISILEKQLEAKSNSVTLDVKEEPPRLVRRKDKDNPFGIPEEDFKKHNEANLPACPAMDWRGTKTPACLRWLEQYFPEFAEDRLYQYKENLHSHQKRLEKKAKKRKEEDKIRSEFPKESGNLFPYQVRNEDEETSII